MKQILIIVVMVTVFLFAGSVTQAERLVLVSASYGKNILAICDSNGKVLWSHKTEGPKKGHAGHHDVQVLANGNILYHDSWTKITEMTLDKKIVWTYDSATMNGNNGKRVHVHAFFRLPNGHTMIAESGVGRIIEVNNQGKIVHQFPLKKGGTQNTRLMRLTPKGNFLVCSEQPGVVTEYNRKGENVWSYLIKTRVYGAIRLRSGNTLIASGGGNSIVEVTTEKKIVWEIKKQVPKTQIELKWMTCLKELENGNIIVGNCHAGPTNPQIFEINRNKKIIWKFNEFDLVGDGLACWHIIESQQAKLIRQKLDALKK